MGARWEVLLFLSKQLTEFPSAFAIPPHLFLNSAPRIPHLPSCLALTGFLFGVSSLCFSWLFFPLSLPPRVFAFSRQTKCTGSGRNQILRKGSSLIHVFWITGQQSILLNLLYQLLNMKFGLDCIQQLCQPHFGLCGKQKGLAKQLFAALYQRWVSEVKVYLPKQPVGIYPLSLL